MANLSNLSEEDIKIKHVLPILQSIGFKDDELSFENRFTLRLGHKTYYKDDEKRGYSDILCKSPDKVDNYFIVEVKKDGLPLTDDDKEQAITYARLVHPIAPYTIVTNGTDTNIYDTISKNKLEEVNTVLVKNTAISIDLASEIKCRYEAMCKLIGYNSKNVAIFSEDQQDKRMSTLIGDKNKKDGKFIPDVYCDPLGLNDVFNEFLNSTDSVFLIIGDQGVGKTNAVCNLATVSKTEHISFFYPGHTITKNLFELIKDDCNWFFSSQLSEIDVIKRLNGFTSDSRKLIIFVDAVDEVSLPDFPKLLDEFVLQSSSFDNLKIVLSSKTQTYQRIITNYGVPTKISEKLFKSKTENKNNSGAEDYNFRINLFNETDFDTCYEKYASFYNYRGELPFAIREELHRGIALKVFALAFQNTEIEPSVNFNQLFTKYIREVLKKSGDDQARNRNEKLLEKLGEQILQKNIIGKHNRLAVEYIDEEEFRSSLGLKVTDSLPQALFDYNILEIYTEDTNTRKIGFYYSFIRDFIIVDRGLEIFSLDEISFVRKIAELSKYDLGKELVYVAFLMANQKYKNYLTQIYENNCLRFAETFINIEAGNSIFKNDGSLFSPSKNYGFLFSVVGKKSSRIIFERKNNELMVAFTSDFCDIEDVFLTRRFYRLSLAVESLLVADPEKTAMHELLKDGLTIIKNGQLNESGCSYLILEQINSLIDANRELLGFNRNNFISPLLEMADLPEIKVGELLNRISRYYTNLFLNNTSFDEQIKYISICNPQSETEVESFSKDNLWRISELLYDNQLRIAKDFYFADDNEGMRILFKLVKNLPLDQIIQNYYPTPQISFREYNISLKQKRSIFDVRKEIVKNLFKNQQIIDYAYFFLSSFMVDYKIIIESNFAGLKENFSLYSNLSNGMTYSIDFNHMELYCTTQSLRSNQQIEYMDCKTFKESCKYYSRSRLSDLFIPNKYYKFGGSNSMNPAVNKCPYRNYLHNWVEKEFSNFIKELES